MRRLVIAALVLLLAGCAPSESAIAEAISATQQSLPTQTPLPTYTPYPTYTPWPTYTPIIPTPTPVFETITVEEVEKAFQDAGLEVVDPTIMTKEDYGLAPAIAKQGVHFLIPSLCSDCGGRIYTFSNFSDREALAAFYKAFGQQGDLLFSWVFVRENIVIQINGDLPSETTHKYETALNELEIAQ